MLSSVLEQAAKIPAKQLWRFFSKFLELRENFLNSHETPKIIIIIKKKLKKDIPFDFSEIDLNFFILNFCGKSYWINFCRIACLYEPT